MHVVFTQASPLRQDVTQGWVLCGKPDCVYTGQVKKSSSPHNQRLHWSQKIHLSSAMRG